MQYVETHYRLLLDALRDAGVQPGNRAPLKSLWAATSDKSYIDARAFQTLLDHGAVEGDIKVDVGGLAAHGCLTLSTKGFEAANVNR